MGGAMEVLHRQGVQSLLVEGGAGLAGSFLEASLVDRLITFRAPVLLGPGALAAFGAGVALDRVSPCSSARSSTTT